MKYRLLALFILAAAVVQAEDPVVEKHYKQALVLREQGEFAAAAEELGAAIALNPSDKELFAKCEMLSAELYVELNMLDAAATTARQIQMLYAGTDYEKQAVALSAKIEELKNQSGKSE